MPPPQKSTTRLPAALLEQFDGDSSSHRAKRKKPIVPRKEARKQARQEQKQRKAAFFSQPKAEYTASLKRPGEEQGQGPAKKKQRVESEPVAKPSEARLKPSNGTVDKTSVKVVKAKQSKTDKESSVKPEAKVKPKTSLEKLLKKPKKSKEVDPEDAHIAWLEAKLGLSGKNGKKNSIAFDDGLDDLMADLDRITPSGSGFSIKSEIEEEEESVEYQAFEEESGEEEEAGSDDGSEYDEEEFKGFSGIEGVLKNVEEADENADMESERPGSPKLNGTAEKTSDPAPTEDAAPSGSKYVPPHLRKMQSEDSERLSKLTRQMKGLLNRMSEQNMATIIQSIEEVYRNQRRNDVTTTITRLVLGGISSHSSLLDTFVVLHAALVAALHKIVGVDFAAHFIQSLVESYEGYYKSVSGTFLSPDNEEQKGKECLNLIVLLSELYNFQIVSCVLVYDIIRGLLENLTEFDVELLLKIARNSGYQLRQDDPSALKDIVEIVHGKVAAQDKETVSSRTKFMIETLNNLKNNKTKRSANPDGHTASVEQMKKFLSGVGKKYHVLAHEPLRISLQDLRSADKRGKWWIVGAAWGGDPLVEHARSQEQKKEPEAQATQSGDVLLKLARKQGMNTDVRRSIFVVLMSSDDYVDACERLGQLSLNETQQREIIRVILHCLGNEKQYNPYYTLIVQHLCQLSHSHKVTLQFCLWDFLRDMGEKDVGGAEILKNSHDDSYVAFDTKKISSVRRMNVARAYAWWLAKSSVTLAILKPVDFTMLQPHTCEFFRNMFYQLFVSTQVTSPAVPVTASAASYLGAQNRQAVEEVFMKATRIPTLTQGLLYLLKAIVRGDDSCDNGPVLETIRRAREIAQDTLRRDTDIDLE